MSQAQGSRDRQPRRFATIIEAADYYRTSTDTIRRRIADGTLTATRLRNSRKILVDLDAADAAMSAIPSASGAA